MVIVRTKNWEFKADNYILRESGIWLMNTEFYPVDAGLSISRCEESVYIPLSNIDYIVFKTNEDKM